MKRLIILVVAALSVTSLAAQSRPHRTVIVRDGKVVAATGDPRVDALIMARRAWLGVTLLDITPELREHYGAPKDSGILVSSVAPDSPAGKAGVRVGDVIVAVDGKDVDGARVLRRTLTTHKEGDSIRIDVLRGRSRQTLVATVVERPRPVIPNVDVEELTRQFSSPEWKARVERMGADCNDLQTHIRDLETRLKDLEKKLQK